MKKKCTLCLGITYPLCFLVGVVLVISGVILLIAFSSIVEGQVNRVRSDSCVH